MMTSKIAFSWTCQPKRKDEYAVNVSAPRNVAGVGSRNSLTSAGLIILVRYVDLAKFRKDAYSLCGYGKDEGLSGRDLGQNGEGGIANETTSYAVDGGLIYRKLKVGGNLSMSLTKCWKGSKDCVLR
jgi:hypothetical protein